MRAIAIYIFVLCIGFNLSAQTTTTVYSEHSKTDVVYLKDGSIFRGNILKYYPNATLKMKIMGGAKVRFKAKDIDKIIQRTSEAPLEERKSPEINPFLEKGFQYTTYLSLLNGTTPWDSDYVLGLGLNYAASYRFNSKYSIGLGSGVDYYYLVQREMVIPVFMEAKRSFVWKNTLQAFVMFSGGYGIGLKSETQNVSDAQGGWMLHPALGLEFGSSKDYHWQIDAGVRLQRATFTFDDRWNPLDMTEHRMTFKRFALRLGLVF